ncbi:MAG: squalene synthase HpnC [Rhodospirillales bacterium]|nr:squalene synthase HpnC [Rhodospirillales bacterium]
MSVSSVETPSGKNAAQENFPVGSWLIAKHLRPHVAAFYAYARAIDDIADTSELGTEEKLHRLDGFLTVLNGAPVENPSGYDKALILRQSLLDSGVPFLHPQNLIKAFQQDSVKNRYDSWDDLMSYCLLSAAPVGRYLIDLHGGFDEPEAGQGYEASDALCAALQVINHLQDCKDDYLTLNRVYLPDDWMTLEQTNYNTLDSDQASAALRRVMDRMLDATNVLLERSQKLHHLIPDRRLAMEVSVIWQIARALCSKLRRNDPISKRVALSKPALLWCTICGIAQAIGKRDIVLPL